MSFVADELVKWRKDPPWYDRIDMDEFEHLAGIGYEPKQIAMYYNVPETDFLWYFNLVGSPLKFHYERGQLVQINSVRRRDIAIPLIRFSLMI